jgi:endonuclease/exonuclease/phosphatase family metal-dependent hydrolase
VRIVTWNIWCNRGASDERLERIVERIRAASPDVLLLQEVLAERGFPKRLSAALAKIGLTHFHFSGGSADMQYGCVIASRYGLRAHKPRVRVQPPWPNLIASARVDAQGTPLVFSVHVPNGSKYKWRKIETLEALTAMTEGAQPTIVGGDFNEPELVLADGRVASFLADEDGSAAGTWLGIPRQRWQTAVEAVLGPAARLRHTWMSRNPGRSAATHVTRGMERFFDHILVSDHFEVRDAGFEHGWRANKNPSDHSGAWAVVGAKS